MAETAAAVKRRVDLPIQGQCESPDDPIWYERMKQAGIDSLHLEVVEPDVRRRILPGNPKSVWSATRRSPMLWPFLVAVRCPLTCWRVSVTAGTP